MPSSKKKAQAEPVRKQAGPTKKQAGSQTKKQAGPVKKQASPAKKPAGPAKKQAGSPTRKQAVPVKKQAGSSAKKQAELANLLSESYRAAGLTCTEQFKPALKVFSEILNDQKINLESNIEAFEKIMNTF